MQGFLASWLPKLGGLAVFLGVLVGQLSRLGDKDQATVCDLTAIYAAFMTFVALLSVRQNGVSSEQAAAGITEPLSRAEVLKAAVYRVVSKPKAKPKNKKVGDS